MTIVERLRNYQPMLWRRFIAAGCLFLCVVVAGLLIATDSYAQKGVRIERKLEEETVPQRNVQPDGLSGGKKGQAINSKTDVDAMPEAPERHELERPELHGHSHHCHLRDVKCEEGEEESK